jgi:UDP-glucose 4-epimerase
MPFMVIFYFNNHPSYDYRMTQSMKTVLVTGAYGFLGRNTALAFAQSGWYVMGLGHGNWSEAEWQSWGISRWYSSDVNAEALAHFGGMEDVIVHAAGGSSVAASLANPEADYLRTVGSTDCISHHVTMHKKPVHIILVSSAAVYGCSSVIPIPEKAQLQPTSVYGRHKMEAEYLLQKYFSTSMHSVSILRLFSAYGPGLRKQLLWDACARFSAGEPKFHGTGAEIRDWCYIDDVVQWAVRLASSRIAGVKIVNGGTGRGITTREVLEKIGREMQSSFAPEFNGVSRPGDPPIYIADVREAQSLGLKTSVSIDSGIDRYVRWWKAQQS